MALERLGRFICTVSEPMTEMVCVRRSGHFKYAPEDSYTCIKEEPRLVRHYYFLGGLFSVDIKLNNKSKTPQHNDLDDLKGGGHLR